MMWDLEEEHNSAYEKDKCERINFLVDLFDEILDYIQDGLYPFMMCVDVFECKANIESEIPSCIQKYYDAHLDENYKLQMKEKYSTKLSLKKMEEGTIAEVFNNVFALKRISESWTGRIETHYHNIEMVAKKLSEEINCRNAERYSLSEENLDLLEDLYIGMLFSGEIIKYGKYAFLVLTGSNE